MIAFVGLVIVELLYFVFFTEIMFSLKDSFKIQLNSVLLSLRTLPKCPRLHYMMKEDSLVYILWHL